MRKALSFLLTLCLLLTLIPAAVFAETPNFSDMPEETHWSYSALQSAVNNGLLYGNGGKINAKSNLTRVEMAAILNRAFGASEKADVSAFKDVKSGTWTESEIAKAVLMGTFMGSGNKMRPNDSITRQEALAVLARAFKLEPGTAADLEIFIDAKKVGTWPASCSTRRNQRLGSC